MGQNKSKPQPGDLIEIDRPHHQHWALYMGDGYVINLTPAEQEKVELEAHRDPVFTRMVKKQLLKKVVGKAKWRVNNQSDQYCSPLPVEEIISRAEAYMDKEVKYHSFGRNCEHFVKKLRYGEAVSEQKAFVGGESHIPDTRDDKDNPKAGDLIEIKRGHYDHWALSVGDGYVIHVIPVDDGVPSLSTSNETILNIKVTKELLKEVAGNDAWAVNNKYDQYRTPLPEEVIIRRAEGCIGKELAYDMFEFESEDFVTKLRYGGQLQVFVGGELHDLDLSIDKDYPKLWDLIEIKRRHYDHWALYAGDGYVIHVTPVDDGVPCMSTSNETILIMKVKMELLKEVAGNDAWAVNNKYDQYRTPLPVEEIIQRVEGCIGKEMAYDMFDFKADDLVTKLRYGGQVSLGGESNILDMRDDKEYPIPGDLIEIDRPLYQHWALYVGNGYVIHVTPVGENSPPMSAGSVTLLIKRAKVKKELLVKAAGKDNWRVNNKYDQFRKPFPVEEIIRRAESKIGEVVRYRLFYKNCEHFVTDLRYGEGVSEQALTALSKVRYISSPLISGVGAAVVSALVRSALLAGFTFPASFPIAAVAGVSLLANIGIVSSNIADRITHAKFQKANKDILEQMCC